MMLLEPLMMLLEPLMMILEPLMGEMRAAGRCTVTNVLCVVKLM
jgi:hypothetical protein